MIRILTNRCRAALILVPVLALMLAIVPAGSGQAEPAAVDTAPILQELAKRAANAERRAGQTRDLAFAIIALLVALPAIGIAVARAGEFRLGRFDRDRELIELRKRQALLRRSVAALAASIERMEGERRYLGELMTVIGQEMATLDRKLDT